MANTRKEKLDVLFEEFLQDCDIDALADEARFWRDAYFDLVEKISELVKFGIEVETL